MTEVIDPASIDLDAVEAYMLTLPQVECPVTHHFGPGVCIRERHMPAGTFLVGHKHRLPNLSMILEGACVVLEDGVITEVQAPFMFFGKPARKAIYVLTDTVWVNIIPTELTDADEIEAAFIEKIDHERAPPWLSSPPQ